ncbi:MAG TPA: ABC transporter substrate-binding protein [Sphingomonas sp.]|nr:ABC transporter substrate-binding protein [Sphingomonas sp.]
MTARSRHRSEAATIALLALTLLGGCDRRHRHGPIEVSVIGAPLGTIRPNPDRLPLDAPAAALIEATGQGLVRFDASGQIVPGVAARWIVADNGRSLIFRLPDLPAPGTRPIDAADVARRIHAAIAPDSRNPLKPLLGAIDEVNAVTPQVIDIELKAPRPNLLQLFAQPALAMGGVHRGPFAITLAAGGVAALRPLADPDSDPDDPTVPRPPIVHLRGERATTAVARFVTGESRLLLGGRFQDLLIARAASLPRNALHFDPVRGLFGLTFVNGGKGLVATADGRRALSMAIDRDRIQRLFDVPGWQPAATIVAPGTPEVPQPATPSWTSLAMTDRTAQAGQIVARWRQGHGGASPPLLRVALPNGPGARILFASILADWRAIGVDAEAVAPDAPANLRLIDEVAPADIASFYLRAFACERQVPCSDVSDRMLGEVRDAPSLDERNVLLMQADALITDTVPFIPLGMPIRWSLVSPELNLYRDSPRGLHPLSELRTPPKR